MEEALIRLRMWLVKYRAEQTHGKAEVFLPGVQNSLLSLHFDRTSTDKTISGDIKN